LQASRGTIRFLVALPTLLRTRSFLSIIFPQYVHLHPHVHGHQSNCCNQVPDQGNRR
jgi:hypothetical protein